MTVLRRSTGASVQWPPTYHCSRRDRPTASYTPTIPLSNPRTASHEPPTSTRLPVGTPTLVTLETQHAFCLYQFVTILVRDLSFSRCKSENAYRCATSISSAVNKAVCAQCPYPLQWLRSHLLLPNRCSQLSRPAIGSRLPPWWRDPTQSACENRFVRCRTHRCVLRQFVCVPRQ